MVTLFCTIKLVKEISGLVLVIGIDIMASGWGVREMH